MLLVVRCYLGKSRLNQSIMTCSLCLVVDGNLDLVMKWQVKSVSLLFGCLFGLCSVVQ
uniref:Uncharacterized protein n=1 Tax=Rhizophora mucronata TaxID=61149 RepID=A0A2P2IIL4_RHIMU